jgi:hypothetical protein
MEGKGGGQLGFASHFQTIIIWAAGAQNLGHNFLPLIDLDGKDPAGLPTLPTLGNGAGKGLVQAANLRRDNLWKPQQQRGEKAALA